MKDELDQYIDAVDHLPAAPVVMIKLIALFREADRDVDEVVKLLSHDPSLTAEMLRRCNGLYFGGEETVVDIFDAIMRLGFYEVYRTAVAMFSLKTLSLGKECGGINVEELWRHSAATAVLAGRLARATGESEGIAYTAGLLHDIGKIVLGLAEGPKYAALTRQIGGDGRALELAEQSIFGFGHGAVGARLLVRWGAPLEISAPIFWHHHDTWSEPFARLSAIVNLGNTAAHGLELGTPSCDWPDALPAMAWLQIENDPLETIVSEAQEELAGLEGLFITARA